MKRSEAESVRAGDQTGTTNTEDFAPMAYDDGMTTTSVHGGNVRQSRSAPSRRRTVRLESRSNRAGELVTMVHRLLSETAHDLCGPLAAVRESVRLVNDGYLGPITEEQRVALLGAINRCGEMDDLVDNMLRLERLRDGMPPVHRRWVNAASIAESVAERIASAGIDEQVSVVWDGPASGRYLLYADPDKLRRLLLNLLGNAIRATPIGGQVMVRTESVKDRGTLRFLIVDRGRGMSPDGLRRLATRGSSSCGGAGLALAISRQMASLHFANLELTSRPEAGTRVSFEVPSAGPSAVADSWCRWRGLFHSSRIRPLRHGIHTIPVAEESRGNDDLEQTPDFSSDTITLTHEGPSPQHPDSLTALSLQLAASTPVELATRMDECLQEGLRTYELAYRAAERRWVLLWDADGAQALDRVANTNRSIATLWPAVRLSWSRAVQLPIAARSTRASVRDLLVRDTLGAGVQTPLGDDRRMAIGNTAGRPAAPDAVTRRLDAELRHLTSRLERQRALMQEQTAAIRPPQGDRCAPVASSEAAGDPARY